MATPDQNAINRLLFMKYPRRMGAIIFAVGGLLIYLCLIDPVRDAQKGAESISLSFTGSSIGVIATLMGLSYLLGGTRIAKIFHPVKGESKVPMTVVYTILIIIALATYHYVRTYLNAMGYRL